MTTHDRWGDVPLTREQFREADWPHRWMPAPPELAVRVNAFLADLHEIQERHGMNLTDADDDGECHGEIHIYDTATGARLGGNDGPVEHVYGPVSEEEAKRDLDKRYADYLVRHAAILASREQERIEDEYRAQRQAERDRERAKIAPLTASAEERKKAWLAFVKAEKKKGKAT